MLRVPLVLLCQNNGWAISVPADEQYVAPIAARAVGYGFPGVRVDGNDVLAVYGATRDALDRARRGEGPTLIEAMTYRIGPHTTADDATKYRSDEEVERWRALDPIARYRRYLMREGVADDAFIGACDEEAEAWVAGVRAELTTLGTPAAAEVFDHVFAAPTTTLAAQRDEALGDA